MAPRSANGLAATSSAATSHAPTPSRGVLVLVGVVLAWMAVVVLWEPAPLALAFDDAWYYQTIARHLAAGDGLTHDGLQPTNGFHPLWQLTLVPVVAAANALGPSGLMRLTLLLQLALLAGAMGLLVRRWPRAALVGALVLLNPYAMKAVVGGMESALQLVLLAAVLAGGPRWLERGRPMLTGLVLGLLVLSRLEAIAFAFAYLALVARDDPRFALRAASVAAVPIVAWAVAVHATVGAVLPVSGLRLSAAPGGDLATALGAAAFVAGAVLAHRLRGRPALSALAFYVGAQLAYVGAFQHRLVPALWYLAPLLLLGVVLLAMGLGALPESVAAGKRAAPWHRARWLVGAAVAIWLAGVGLGWAHRLDARAHSSYAAARRDGRWLAEHLGPGDHAAGWDVGIVAAHAHGRVANLEGLVAAPGFDPFAPEAFLNEHASIRYLVQYIRETHLCGPAPLVYAGVELEGLPVVRHEAAVFEAADPRFDATIHRMIFEWPGAPTDDVGRIRRRACE